jgi:hypothetical protein
VVDNGSLPSVNAWYVANILWGAFTGITQLAITRERLRVKPKEIDDLLSLCFDMIQRGLSAGPPATKKKAKGRGSGIRDQGSGVRPGNPAPEAKTSGRRRKAKS